MPSVVVSLACVTGGAAAAPGCAVPDGATRLLATAHVLAWEQTGSSSETVFACERPGGKVRVIARPDPFYSETVSRFRAAGRYLAFTDDSQIVSSQTQGDIESLNEVDVRSGHLLFSEPVAGTSSSCPDGDCSGGGSDVTTLEDYAINARGFGAWITRSNGREKLSAHAHIGTRVIAHGTKLTGIRFRGDVLSWRAGGSLRSVRLR